MATGTGRTTARKTAAQKREEAEAAAPPPQGRGVNPDKIIAKQQYTIGMQSTHIAMLESALEDAEEENQKLRETQDELMGQQKEKDSGEANQDA